MAAAESALTRRTRLGPEWVLGSSLSIGAAILALFLGGKAVVLVALALAVPMALVLVLARPERAFPIFLIGLPIYFLSLVILYGVVQLPALAVRMAQLWKELLLVTALVGCWLRWRGTNRVTLSRLDWLVFAFALLNVIYIAFPEGATSLIGRFGGARNSLAFVGFYVLGRLTRLDRGDVTLAVRIVVVLATSAILGVIIEKAFLPSDWPLRIGYSRFLIDFFNGAGVQSADELPWSFWTQARIFRRPSAYFASPLDMAAACLVFLGAAAAAYWTARERGKRRLGWLVLCIALVGVILASLTRMASISVPIVLAVAALALGRKRVAMVILGVSLLAGAAAFIVATPLLQDYVKNTLIFEDSSSAGHMEEWLRGVHAILQNPWGLGLGTSGIVGARVGENIGGENQYLIYGVQLGVVGLVLYTAVIAAANVAVVRALHRVRDPLHGLALGAVLAITLLGVTSEIGIYIFVAYVGWWLIGRAVSEQFRTGSTPLARLPS